jgi:hypothetical protein
MATVTTALSVDEIKGLMARTDTMTDVSMMAGEMVSSKAQASCET